MSQDLNLKALLSRNKNSSKLEKDIESDLFSILDPALQDPSSTSPPTVAQAIDDLYSSDYNNPDKAEDFHYTLWNFYIAIIKQIPSEDDSRLSLVADIVKGLKGTERGTAQIWGEDKKVWSSLPLLGPDMRDAWNFEPKLDGSDADNKSIAEWTSLNSFAARLLGAGTTSWTNFALWSLRDHLETPLTNDKARESSVGVAAEWFIHAAEVIFREGTKTEELSESDEMMLQPGELFKGESGFSDERWQFWRERIEELGSEAGGDAHAVAEKGLSAMKTAEKS